MNDKNRRQTTEADRRQAPRGGRRTTDVPGRHPTVAVVERYEGVRRTCARYLDHFHFNVVEAADADDGLRLLEQTKPAVLLVEDATSAYFERLRQQARELSIPIVSMTTVAHEPTSPGDSKSVLVKPFPLGTMLDEIRRALRT